MKRPYNFDNKFFAWMEKVADHYNQSLLKSSRAIEYLNSRGIIASEEVILAFRLGFCDGSFGKTLNEKDRSYLFKIGLLYEDGNEKLRNHVVFPLWDKELPVINNFYGRYILRPRHFYLQNTARSLFNPTAAYGANEIIITESIIDALALWSVGVKNVIPIYGTTGWTKAILNHLKDNKIKRVVLFLDSDIAGRKAAISIASKLKASKIKTRVLAIPQSKDLSEFISANLMSNSGRVNLENTFREMNLF